MGQTNIYQTRMINDDIINVSLYQFTSWSFKKFQKLQINQLINIRLSRINNFEFRLEIWNYQVDSLNSALNACLN